MHHLRSTRRLALGAPLAVVAAGAVPTMAGAASTCTYYPQSKSVYVADDSGTAKLRIMRSGQRIQVSDGFGPRQDCLAEASAGSDQALPATVTNTDSISLYGPVPLYLYGGDQLIGGSNDDHVFGGDGPDVFHTIGGGSDILFGEGAFDTANPDTLDTPGDVIELKHYGF